MIKQISILFLGLSLGGFLNTAVASSVTIPNTFTSGTPAVAAEVNGNFTAIKNGVDDNNNRIKAIETSVISVNLTGLVDAGSYGSCKLIRFADGGVGYTPTSGTNCIAYMSVNLPQGRTLLTMSCSVYDQDGGTANHRVDSIDLKRTSLSTGTAENVFKGPPSNGWVTVQKLVASVPQSGTQLVDNMNYSYFIRADMDAPVSGDIVAYGCRITYQ